MDEMERNFAQAVQFHQRMIKRARMWAVISIVAGLAAIFIGVTLFDESNGKTISTIAGSVLSLIGLAWPMREMYNIRNRIEALQMFRDRYFGPPPANDDDKKIIKTTLDTIIQKSL